VRCDAPHGFQFLITALGVMPVVASSVALAPGQFVSVAHARSLPRVSVPPSPPPRLG
jgi:hypothetical protein